MTAYYYGDQPKLTDEEFALLKEELIWNGSKVRRPACWVLSAGVISAKAAHAASSMLHGGL